jgi:acetyl-CoA synthetase
MSEETKRFPTIHKSPAQQASCAMGNYEQLSTQFSWQSEKEALKLQPGQTLNQVTACLDRHPEFVMNRKALLWQGKSGEQEAYTFSDLRTLTIRFAMALKTLGIQKGDRVFVFLERVPELFVSIFSILRAGAIAGPLFSAFGPEAIQDRLQDSGAVMVITSPALKPKLDSIKAQCPALKHIIVVDRESVDPSTLVQHEYLYSALMAQQVLTNTSEAEMLASLPQITEADYSVIHYTSGTTGKPKGVVHCHGAVVAQASTAKHILDFRPDTDLYWCTADPGWVTGTSYGMFGPWALGVSMLVYEGGFNPETWYQLIQDYGVTVWYTAPTAIRMLMKAGDALPGTFDFSALRHLCSVGEPLNPEAVVWGEQVFGKVFHDTWWQTETGSMHICNYPAMAVKPGSMGKPFPGTDAGILDDQWQPLAAGEEGHLAIRPFSPSMFKTYWGKHDLFESRFKQGWYMTGDRAKKDEDGYYWFIGRADDVINTAGHLVGPFEVESALVEHPAVAEAGVIGKPDAERMEIIKAFVSLKAGYTPSDELASEIRLFVRNRLAAHAYPREIAFVESLPKTRSGKIMRRLLKARELGLPEGDTSTLED